MKHPIQPLELDDSGTVRFKPNKLVQYLLDNGGIDMNHLARQQFTHDEREQFAQLIGYSLSGYGELSYVSDETYGAAVRMYEDGESESTARINYLEGELTALRDAMRAPIARLYGIHQDDITK